MDAKWWLWIPLRSSTASFDRAFLATGDPFKSGCSSFYPDRCTLAVSKRQTGAHYLFASIFVILLGAVHDYFVFSKVYDFPYLFDVAIGPSFFEYTRGWS